MDLSVRLIYDDTDVWPLEEQSRSQSQLLPCISEGNIGSYRLLFVLLQQCFKDIFEESRALTGLFLFLSLHFEQRLCVDGLSDTTFILNRVFFLCFPLGKLELLHCCEGKDQISGLKGSCPSIIQLFPRCSWVEVELREGLM